jgi:hypothetical protein
LKEGIPEACGRCNGKGWLPKTIITGDSLRAAARAIRVPVTMSLQLADIPLQLTAGASDLTKQPFLATVTCAGYVSDGCVGGTEFIKDDAGKVVGPLRVLIPVEVMNARVAGLIGKSVFAAQGLDSHDNAAQIGQFLDSRSERVPGTEIYQVYASGFLDKKSDPALIAKIIDRARSGELGFSYDLKNFKAHLDSEVAPGETILILDDFEWRGATALRREAAAYFFTNLAANKLETPPPPNAASADLENHQPAHGAPSTRSTQPELSLKGNTIMNEEQLKALMATLLAPLTAGIAEVKTTQQAVGARLDALEAAGKKAPEKTEDGKKPEVALTAADLTKTITEAVTAAVTAGLKTAGVGAGAEEQNGKRKTLSGAELMKLSAADLATVKRWAPDSVVGEETTIDGFNMAIAHINASTTGDERKRALDSIVPIKKRLERELMGVN